MAIHIVCPGSEASGGAVVGTALEAVRCINVDNGTCKSNGETASSLYRFCKACAGDTLCEVCGELLGDDKTNIIN